MWKQKIRQLNPDIDNAFDAMLDWTDQTMKQLQSRLYDKKSQLLFQSILQSMRSQILNFNLMKEGDNH